MTIEKRLEGKDLLVKVSGELDTVTSPDLEAELQKDIDTIETLTFDLSELLYVSSAGLRVLLAAQKNMMKKGGMKLCNVQETVMDILQATGFVDILIVE